jgi:hypothetical protein
LGQQLILEFLIALCIMISSFPRSLSLLLDFLDSLCTRFYHCSCFSCFSPLFMPLTVYTLPDVEGSMPTQYPHIFDNFTSPLGNRVCSLSLSLLTLLALTSLSSTLFSLSLSHSLSSPHSLSLYSTLYLNTSCPQSLSPSFSHTSPLLLLT